MNREQFLARMRDIILRGGTSDGPALVRMLEKNCLGPAVAQIVEHSDIHAEARVIHDWEDTMPEYARIEHAEAECLKLLQPDGKHYIDAIKRYRELTRDDAHPVGLADAKKAIDALCERHNIAKGAAPAECTCGHAEHEHIWRLRLMGDAPGGRQVRGNCGRCDCREFRHPSFSGSAR